MSEVEFTDFYIVVRMWCPPDQCADPEKPRYVARIDDGGDGPTKWTTTKNWREANFFKSARVAGRVIHGVDRVRTRIARGWVYEIVKVTEEVLSSNLDNKLEEEAA